MTSFVSQLISLLEDEDFVKSKMTALLSTPQEQSGDYVPDEQYDPEIYIKLSANFSLFIEDVFKLLNSSILHGEYFTEPHIDKLTIHLVESSNKFVATVQATLIETPYYTYLGIFWNVITKAISEFQEFVTTLRNKAQSEKKVFYPISSTDFNALLEGSKYMQESDATIYNKLYADCVNRYRLFRINMTTSRNEFLLQSVDFDKLLTDLLADINWIFNLGNSILLCDPIRLKCYYLFRKIRYRVQLESKEEVIFWDGKQPLNLSDHEIVDPFSEWISTIHRHYELKENSKAEIIGLATKNPNLVSKQFQNLTTGELHSLIKYYKDCTTGDYRDELTKLADIFAKKYKAITQAGNIFDSYAASFNINYAINNEFSALLDNPNSDFNTVRALYEKINRIQEQTGIDNFFPQWKYLGYLINKKVKGKLSDGIFDKLLNVKFFISEAERIQQRYDHNIYWTQNTYNYIFYLPLNECSVPYDDKEKIISRIFVASSFVLPLVQHRYIADYEIVKRELINLKNSVEVLDLIASEHKIIKEKNLQLETDIRGKETKYIEILGIFASIITFAAAAFTTQLGATKDGPARNLIPGLLSIGLILFLFVFAILIVTRIPFEKMWQKAQVFRKFYVVIIAALITIIISVSLSFIIFNYFDNMVEKRVPSPKMKPLVSPISNSIQTKANNNQKITDTLSKVVKDKKE